MKGKVYTSYFSNIKNSKGLVISISRFNPSWLKLGDIDDWMFNLAPSERLLFGYKDGSIDKNEYTRLYNLSLKFKKDDISKLQKILDSGNDITLLCYEKPTDFCHRHLLRDYLCSLGYVGNEI